MLAALAKTLRVQTDARLHLPEGVEDADVTGVQHDSRAAGAGDLFVAIEGASFDGTRFAPGAIESGAVAVLASRPLELAVPQLIANDVRRAMAFAAHAVYGHPTAHLDLVGITGTNGKTTTSYLVDGMLRALERSPWMLGTVEIRAGEERRPASFTTPESDDLARFAREAVDGGASHLVMEVSSHGLAQDRARGARFAVAAFTNLSRDHLDFHGTMEAYLEAKASLFTEHGPKAAVINVDDPAGAQLAERIPNALTVGRRENARLRIVGSTMAREGIRAELSYGGQPLSLESSLVGGHNLENLVVALGCGIALGIDPAEACAALGRAPAAPGRLEPVADPRGVTVLVDYAHTPDALHNALRAVRPITEGRLMVVFGCGGDRDPGKRPQMGRAAAEGADVVVVTSDNPRTEDPSAIVEAIVPGVEATGLARASADADRGFVVEVDRERAIQIAVAAARPGDTLLIAGKGHEDYQIVGTTKRHFDDREIARAAIAAATGEGA
ncbi:MAG: UDP-N-acetylmuramoyl-L-alanyl-D-glutamate--2,6-diaminopimelate ligase [Deltaproteobacteria bacterium]|nr:UDP-N-acetylmuramoyl-L-alanyl-D-glutamate--2,6-diaminopimelate ligase [Deltaproteobacteria bacterium]